MKRIAPFALLFCLLIASGLWYVNRPVEGCLTPENLGENLTKGGQLVLLDDTCYELDTAESLAGFVDVSCWYEGNGRDAGAHIITLKLGDEYEIAFYENSWVKAYYGYASWKNRGTVWYKVTEQDMGSMIEYIQTNADVKEPLLGPESWFVLHE